MDYYLLPDLKQLTSPVSGCALLNPGWTHMTRRLEQDSVLIFGRKNHTLLTDNDKVLEIQPGRIVLLPAGNLHRGIERITEPVSYYWIHLRHTEMPIAVDTAKAEQILSQPRLAARHLVNAALLPQTFEPVDRDHIQHLFEEALAEFKREEFGDLRYQLLVQLLLVQLSREAMRLIHRRESMHIRRERPPLLDRILLFVEEELSNTDLSVKLVASHLGLNDDYLGRSFKKAMGIPLGAYIVERRIALARTRLRETGAPLEAISTQCGFGSLRQFHHHFKEHEGTTPGTWRRNCGSIGLVGL